MRPKILSISPYAAGDPNLVVTSERPVALTALTLTSSPLVFDVPRTVLFTFADGPVGAAIAEDDAVFTDETTEANEATSTESVLRFEAWWRLHPWMVVHCYRNLQLVADALACNLQPRDDDMASLASSLRIPGEAYLRVDPGRLERSVRKVNIASVTNTA